MTSQIVWKPETWSKILHTQVQCKKLEALTADLTRRHFVSSKTRLNNKENLHIQTLQNFK